MEIIAVLSTIFAGLLTEVFIGHIMPGFSNIIAVAVMGAFILQAVKNKK